MQGQSVALEPLAKNRHHTPRILFFASYVADWVRQEENQYLTVPPAIAEELPERAQQMIGYQCNELVGWSRADPKRTSFRRERVGASRQRSVGRAQLLSFLSSS